MKYKLYFIAQIERKTFTQKTLSLSKHFHLTDFLMLTSYLYWQQNKSIEQKMKEEEKKTLGESE